MPAVYSFVVPDISCNRCISAIEKKLKEMDGVTIERIASNVTQKKIGLLLQDDINESEIRKKITISLQQIGFSPVFSDKTSIEEQTRSHRNKGIIGSSTGVILLLMTLIFSPISMGIMIPITIISSLLTLYLGAESYKRAFYELKSAEFSMDTLFAVSTAVVILTSIISLFVPWLPMMCEAGLLIFGFRHLGLYIESWINNTMQLGVFFVDRLPKEVRVVQENGMKIKKNLKKVAVGEIIEIASKEDVPLDGTCINENVFVYDTIISGKTLPREVKKGEGLFSGMEVAEGSTLRLKVSQPFNKSHLYRLDQRIFDAEFEQKSNYEITANKVLKYFVPAVFVFAIISALCVGYIFSVAVAVQCIIAVLVSACPCTLGLVVPLAVSIAKYKAAANGVEFKSGEKLQLASEVDCVVFDFNGTLTSGSPKVVKERQLKEMKQGEFYRIVSLLEKNTRHPVGSTLYKHVNIQANEDIQVKRKYFGVIGCIDGKTYMLGSKSMMIENNVSLRSMEKEGGLSFGESAVYLSCDGELVGYFVLATSLREGAIEASEMFKKMGIEQYICSGSDPELLEGFAKKLGIPFTNIIGSQRGSLDGEGKDDDKSRFIKQLKQKYKVVAMVGDAVNDVLALKESEFGLAICHANSDEKVTEKACAVVKGESLLPVVNTFLISRQMKKNIKQNMVMSFIYNIVAECVAGGVLVGLGLILNPGIGVTLMIIQMCLILANAYRFKVEPLTRFNEKHLKLSSQKILSTEISLGHEKRPTPLAGKVYPPVLLACANRMDISPLNTSLPVPRDLSTESKEFSANAVKYSGTQNR